MTSTLKLSRLLVGYVRKWLERSASFVTLNIDHAFLSVPSTKFTKTRFIYFDSSWFQKGFKQLC